jgi:hypothetical protein
MSDVGDGEEDDANSDDEAGQQERVVANEQR